MVCNGHQKLENEVTKKSSRILEEIPETQLMLLIIV